MYLNILPGREVKIACGKFVRYICNALPLGKRHFAIRQFYTHHLHSGLTLSIYTTGQTQAAKFLFRDCAFPEFTNLSFELKNISFYNRIFKFSTKTLHGLFVL